MKKYIATTTINPPTEALIKYSKLKDWTVIVAGDLKTDHSLYQNLDNVIYLHPEEQEKKYPKLSELIGWRCIQRRNFAILEAPMPINEILVQRRGITTPEWCAKIETEIRKSWAGPIVWRPKAGSKATRFQRFQDQLVKAHAVVGERTMACVESCLLGVPAYTVDTSVTTLLMGGVDNLANITYPDRADWWDHIAWSQFHIDEFANGEVAELVELYQIR